MNIQSLRKLAPLALLGGMLTFTPAVLASDLVVSPDPTMPYGGHEIWANGEIGQSFVAQGSTVKGGFLVEYSPESAALMAPNDTTTQVVINLYDGEGIDSTKLLATNTMTVDSTQKGFLDVDYAAAGVSLTVGKTYTIGIVSPYNRGWIVPSVCSYPANAQPTGAYDQGHPFFQGQIVLDETGICDNGFRFLDTAPVITPTPTPTAAPSPTPTPSTLPTTTTKKAEGKGTIMAVGTQSITVNKVVVYFTPTTLIKLNYEPAMMVGQKAQYKGFRNTDGSVTATYIEVQ